MTRAMAIIRGLVLGGMSQIAALSFFMAFARDMEWLGPYKHGIFNRWDNPWLVFTLMSQALAIVFFEFAFGAYKDPA